MSASVPYPRLRGAIGFMLAGASCRQAALGGDIPHVAGWLLMAALFAVAAVQMLGWGRGDERSRVPWKVWAFFGLSAAGALLRAYPVLAFLLALAALLLILWALAEKRPPRAKRNAPVPE